MLGACDGSGPGLEDPDGGSTGDPTTPVDASVDSSIEDPDSGMPEPPDVDTPTKKIVTFIEEPLGPTDKLVADMAPGATFEVIENPAGSDDPGQPNQLLAVTSPEPPADPLDAQFTSIELCTDEPAVSRFQASLAIRRDNPKGAVLIGLNATTSPVAWWYWRVDGDTTTIDDGQLPLLSVNPGEQILLSFDANIADDEMVVEITRGDGTQTAYTRQMSTWWVVAGGSPILLPDFEGIICLRVVLPREQSETVFFSGVGVEAVE